MQGERRGDYYIVNGQKTWTTLAQYGDWIFCLVRTSNEGKPQTGISFLLIDMKTPGVSVRPITMLDGSQEVNEVWFDNVEVPADQLIGEENKGWTYAKHLLSHERTNIADVNRAKRELERCKRIAKAEGLWDDTRFRDQIALLEVDVVALEMMVLRVLSAEKSGKQSLDVAGLLKIRGSEIQQRYTELMMLAAGPFALPLMREAMEAGWQGEPVGAAHCAPLAATYFNYRKTSIYGGSNEVQTQHRRADGVGELNMDFDFTDDQNALRDAVARWVEKDFAFARRHAIAKQGGRTREVYRELAELGLAGLAIAPEHGGMGFGAVEAMVVMEELGRGLVNAPYAAGALVAPSLVSDAGWLARIADGSALVVLAQQERGARYRCDAPAATAVQQGGGWALSGAQAPGAGRRRGRRLRRAGAFGAARSGAGRAVPRRALALRSPRLPDAGRRACRRRGDVSSAGNAAKRRGPARVGARASTSALPRPAPKALVRWTRWWRSRPST